MRHCILCYKEVVSGSSVKEILDVVSHPASLSSGGDSQDQMRTCEQKYLTFELMIKELGLARFRQAITQNIRQARHLTKLVEESDELELLAPTSMNIVCFRYARGDDLDALNEEILLRLHESGVAAPSYTRLNGNYAIRVANTNHRSRSEDFDILVQKVLELGRGLTS